jgi:hypothetical protein
MKKYLIGAAIGIAITVISGLLYQHYVVAPELKAKEDAYNILKTQTDADQKAREALIADQIKKIVQLDGQITEAYKRIGVLTAAVGIKETEVGVLEGQAKVLRTEVDAVIKANPKLSAFVLNLETQLADHKQIEFTLKQALAEKDGIIADKDSKFNALKIISDQTAKAYAEEHALRMNCEGLVKAEKKRGTFNLFGLRINLLSDIIVPSATFTLGYFLGKKRG